MICRLFGSGRNRVFIDINTQKDYFLSDGKACIRNHRRVLGNIRRLMAWVRKNNIPVISTLDIHSADNGSSWCLEGTDGQKKISYTSLYKAVEFQADGLTDIPEDLFSRYCQALFPIRCTDPFEEPRIERLLSEMGTDEFVLAGGCAEGTVKAMALGLLQRGKHVMVVSDAVGSRDLKEGKLAFAKIKAKGAKLVDTKEIAGVSSLRKVGTCGCSKCAGHSEKAHVKI